MSICGGITEHPCCWCGANIVGAEGWCGGQAWWRVVGGTCEACHDDYSYSVGVACPRCGVGVDVAERNIRDQVGIVGPRYKRRTNAVDIIDGCDRRAQGRNIDEPRRPAMPRRPVMAAWDLLGVSIEVAS